MGPESFFKRHRQRRGINKRVSGLSGPKPEPESWPYEEKPSSSSQLNFTEKIGKILTGFIGEERIKKLDESCMAHRKKMEQNEKVKDLFDSIGGIGKWAKEKSKATGNFLTTSVGTLLTGALLWGAVSAFYFPVWIIDTIEKKIK